MENDILITKSPHIRTKFNIKYIMYIVVLSLLPSAIFGIYNFGNRAFIIILTCVSSSILVEYLYQYFMKLKISAFDGSAAITGLLISLNVPVSIPIYIPIIGCIFAIIIVKQLFGGIGCNIVNPAICARCFLLISFTKYMTHFTYDGITNSTPLFILKSNGKVDLLNLFIGKTSGTIGETSTVFLLVGVIILLLFKIIDLIIPLSYLLSFTLFISIFGSYLKYNSFDLNYILTHICGGGLMLGAWFMATDYVTRPIKKSGQIIFGIMCGLLTGLFRLFGPFYVTEGVSYAILISNIFVPLINKFSLNKK